MSNDESRKNNLRMAVFLISGLLVIGLLMLILHHAEESEQIQNTEISEEEEYLSLPLSELEIKYGADDTLSLSATLSREELTAYLGEKGIEAGGFVKLLPENVSVSCTCRAKVLPSEKSVAVELLSATVNGVGIPRKILSEMGEIKLDFERSLVYN